ncbi:lanthionine synthetase C family protein, partial [Streptomyces sp. UNOC14_S4]|uniref:lanthionine synthetase C family protein n=1 Tax=Streptomyces sp. UNOC14_S4 TaxID=2872340 RepID=UPI001E30D8B2
AFPALRALAPLVLGLTADGPSRWPLDKAAAFLRAEPAGQSASAGPALPRHHLDRLIADGLDHLAATAEPAAEYLWPTPRALPHGDPCSVRLGAAGALAALDRAARTGETRAEPLLRTAAYWLDERLTLPSRILPGLHSGRSGAVWALHDAARTIGDATLAGRAREYALRIPLDWHDPDVCHGLAGAGLAQLHLWHTTRDHRFADRTMQCADALLGLTGLADGGVDWPVDTRHRAELAGSAGYGFAHGVAGNAAFLLAAGRDLGSPDLVDIAVGAGHTLCAVAERHGDAAYWPGGPRRGGRTGPGCWCDGASGVGTFLVRLWRLTGDRLFRTWAERAARAAYRDRWRLAPGVCHGVAGDAELLLDLADATGQERYRDRAAEAAMCLYVRAARRDGRLVMPDDIPCGADGIPYGTDGTPYGTGHGHGTGAAGALDFLLRLKHGGPRSWLVDSDR